LLNSGKLQIYGDTQAADGNTAVGTQTLLAELVFAGTAVASVTGGVATFNTITGDSSANNTDNATWFRCLKSDDTKVFDGSIGTSGCDMNINSIAITTGAAVAVTGFTYTATPTA
jgi:hypothetical protein